MQRLLDDAEKISGIKYDISSFADITQAIHVMQEEMGIAGATALEAGTTIEGSVNAMKGAWQNLVTGFADGNADIGQLINNLVETIVGNGTETNLGVIGNVLPAIETALGGVVKLIEGAAPKIIEILPELVDEIIPSLISASTSLVEAVIEVLPDLFETLIEAVVENAPMLIDASIALIETLSMGFLEQLPQIVQLGLNLILSLATGIAQSLPNLIPTIISVILKIVEILTNQETLTQLLFAAFTIITELAWGLIDNIDKIIDAVVTLFDGMIDFLLRPANLAMLIETAIELVLAIGTGIIKAIPQLLVSVGSLIASIFANFFTADWKSIGTNIVDGLKQGIANAWKNLKKWFKGLFDDIIGIAKKILGIASPSKVFKSIGKFTAEGFGVGFEDEFDDVKDDIEDSLDFGDPTMSISSYGTGYGSNGGFGGSAIVNNTFVMGTEKNTIYEQTSNLKATLQLMRLKGIMV